MRPPLCCAGNGVQGHNQHRQRGGSPPALPHKKMKLIILLSIFLLILAGLLKKRHVELLRRLPLRVHVNGTRGKSGVTRLITAGLRAGGLAVLGKTTGTAARLLEAEGERPFRRTWLCGPPSIGEQGRLVRQAVGSGVQALVSECMAVHPEIQRVSEAHFLQATHTVITNVRQDHSDVMGETLAEVAETLALTVPRGGELILGPDMAEEAVFTREAATKGTRVVRVAALSGEERVMLPETMFADNVATALTVCERLGVERETALRAMLASARDPGELKVLRVEAGGRGFWFVDAFAVNDAASTLAVWRRCRALPELGALPAVGLCNSRADRGYRLEELARDFAVPAARSGLGGVLVLGEGLLSARKLFLQSGLEFVHIPALLRRPRVPELLDTAAKYRPAGGDVLLFGFGNTQGMGNTVTEWFVRNGVGR